MRKPVAALLLAGAHSSFALAGAYAATVTELGDLAAGGHCRLHPGAD